MAISISSPNLVYSESVSGDNRELPALPSPNVVYPEDAFRDNRELPALTKRARYARPTSERRRKALAHSLEHAIPVPHQRGDAMLLLIR